MTIERTPLFCDADLAERIERAESELIEATALAAHRRLDDGRGFVIPIAGGLASFADDDSPFKGEIGDCGEKAPVSRGMGRRRVGRVGQLLIREAAFRPQQVERPVRDDPVQPRAERAALVEATECGESALEPVCGHVVRKGVPPGDGEGGTPGIPPVAAKEQRRSFTVATTRPPHEISITRFTHSSAVLRASGACTSRKLE